MNYNDILRLVRASAKHYPGGITAIAAIMETSPIVLANKLNENYASNHLTFKEFIRLSEITGDYSSLQSIASLLDRTTIPKPCCSNEKDTLNHFLKMVQICGEIGNEIQKATAADSELGEKLSKREKERITNELEKMLDAVYCLLQTIQSE